MSDVQIFGTDLEKRVRGYIRARAPCEDAEDVIQDAWLRIVKNWSSYKPERSHNIVWVWAKYHCKSAVAEYYRRREDTQEVQDGDAILSPSRSVAEYEQLLEVAFAASADLHQLIIFGYVQLLEWRPAEVVADLSSQALEDLGNRFIMEYSARFTHDRDAILDLLRPFTERLRGIRAELAHFFSDPTDHESCAAEVSHWRYSVLRRLRSDLLFLQALETLLTSSHPRHEQIVRGLIEILRWSPRTLANKHANESLRSLAERLEDGCITRRRHLSSLIRRIFRPLHHDSSLADRKLRDSVPEGRRPEDEFVLWSTPPKGDKP